MRVAAATQLRGRLAGAVHTEQEARGKPPRVALAGHHRERLRIGSIVADDQRGRRSVTLEKPRDGISLRPGPLRPELHDPPAVQASESRATEGRWEPRGCLVEGSQDPRPGGHVVLGGPEVERDGRTFRFDEQPRRAVEQPGHLVTQPSRNGAMPGKARVFGHNQSFGSNPHRQIPALDPVVAQVGQPANPDAAGHVQRGSPREDRDRQPPRTQPDDPGEAAERPAGRRQDRRRRRVEGDRRQRPVEVAHDKERAGRGGERANGVHRPDDGARLRIVDGSVPGPFRHRTRQTCPMPVGTAAARGPRPQGVTVTPGRIAWSPRAITSLPIPPRAASRTIPWASMK